MVRVSIRCYLLDDPLLSIYPQAILSNKYKFSHSVGSSHKAGLKKAFIS